MRRSNRYERPVSELWAATFFPMRPTCRVFEQPSRAALVTAQTLQGCECLPDRWLKLPIGVTPGVADKAVILECGRTIAKPLGQTRTLQHERHPTIIGAIKYFG